MARIVLDGESLTPGAVAAVARDGEAVALAPAARARNADARATLAALLERGEDVYGATTGVGALRDRQIDPPDREQLQWNLLRSHAVDAGPALPADVVRAAMVVRANQLGAGGAGVAEDLLDALVRALNQGRVPQVRQFGSLGTGDVAGLAQIALTLLGDGGSPHDQGTIRLGLRDAVGFTSSNAITIGRAALLAEDLAALHDCWLTVAALSFEAAGADPVVLDERVHAASRGGGQCVVAARMRRLLSHAGAGIAGDASLSVAASTGQVAVMQLVQDPYPFRVLPQVDGVASDALQSLHAVLVRELNVRGENALIADERAWPNGNFHGAALAAALDALRAAVAQSASLIAARISCLLDPRLTGLPPFLAAEPGLQSGMMMLEYTGQSAAAEARALAAPMAAQAVGASLGVESHGSLAATSARYAAEQLDAVRVLVGTELVVAMRALELSRRVPRGAGTSRLFALARERLPAGLEDRRFSEDVEAAVRLVASWVPAA